MIRPEQDQQPAGTVPNPAAPCFVSGPSQNHLNCKGLGKPCLLTSATHSTHSFFPLRLVPFHARSFIQLTSHGPFSPNSLRSSLQLWLHFHSFILYPLGASLKKPNPVIHCLALSPLWKCDTNLHDTMPLSMIPTPILQL